MRLNTTRAIFLAGGLLAALCWACQAPPGQTQRPDSSLHARGSMPKFTAKTYYAHANLLERQGDLGRAAGQYRDALKLDPDMLAAKNRLGITLNKLGRHHEASVVFRSAIARHPQLAYLQNNLGFSLLLDGKYADAQAALRRALELKPQFSRARMNHGIALAKLERFDEAYEEFARVGGKGEAYFNMAIMLADAQEYTEAMRFLHEALLADPSMASAKRELDRLAVLAARAEAERKEDERKEAERLAAIAKAAEAERMAAIAKAAEAERLAEADSGQPSDSADELAHGDEGESDDAEEALAMTPAELGEAPDDTGESVVENAPSNTQTVAGADAESEEVHDTEAEIAAGVKHSTQGTDMPPMVEDSNTGATFDDMELHGIIGPEWDQPEYAETDDLPPPVELGAEDAPLGLPGVSDAFNAIELLKALAKEWNRSADSISDESKTQERDGESEGKDDWGDMGGDSTVDWFEPADAGAADGMPPMQSAEADSPNADGEFPAGYVENAVGELVGKPEAPAVLTSHETGAPADWETLLSLPWDISEPDLECWLLDGVADPPGSDNGVWSWTAAWGRADGGSGNDPADSWNSAEAVAARAAVMDALINAEPMSAIHDGVRRAGARFYEHTREARRLLRDAVRAWFAAEDDARTAAGGSRTLRTNGDVQANQGTSVGKK